MGSEPLYSRRNPAPSNSDILKYTEMKSVIYIFSEFKETISQILSSRFIFLKIQIDSKSSEELQNSRTFL
uniref:Uncharacterized protein n=1 Tax=Caenorhabditis tropicalis TaxID=1561998 RepID=A0A1I7U9Y4_9PELO